MANPDHFEYLKDTTIEVNEGPPFLTSLAWLHLLVPKSWLELNIIYLYKKGLKSLAENYRALSIGFKLSKLIPRIILNRLHATYEHNISEAQFGFRKGRSTCDAISIIKNVIQNILDHLF